MLADDDVTSITLSELSQKLQSETAVPEGYNILLEANHLIIYWLTVEDDVPKVTSSVTVSSDLAVVASMDGVVVPASLLTDLVTGPIEQMSQLVNVMARIKAYGEDSRSRSLQCSVQTAVSVLKRSLETLDETDGDEYRKISFVIEQLQLLLTDKYG